MWLTKPLFEILGPPVKPLLFVVNRLSVFPLIGRLHDLYREVRTANSLASGTEDERRTQILALSLFINWRRRVRIASCTLVSFCSSSRHKNPLYLSLLYLVSFVQVPVTTCDHPILSWLRTSSLSIPSWNN